MIKFEKQTSDNKDVWYEVLDDGFKIYIEQTIRPVIHQYEHIYQTRPKHMKKMLRRCVNSYVLQATQKNDL